MMRAGLLLVALAGLLMIAGSARAACKLGKIAELPVTMAGLKPMVPAKINGTEVIFVADSGASFSTLTRDAAARFNLRLASTPYWLHVKAIGGEANAEATMVSSFGLAGKTMSNLQFLVCCSEPGGGAVGVIGQNILRLADVEYDFANGVIRLMKPLDCPHTDMAYWADGKPHGVMDIRPTDRSSPLTIGRIAINGYWATVLFDTGSDTTVLTAEAARRIGVSTEGPNVRPAGFVEGAGRRPARAWIARVATVQMGDETVYNSEVRIADFDLDTADMLIGADFFLSHRVYVSNAQHKLYFTYNGGPVFNLTPALQVAAAAPAQNTSSTPAQAASSAPASKADAAAAEPADADGFARRGAAHMSRREYGAAIADFTRAIELAPHEARYFNERAMARLAAKQPSLAMADVEAALKLKPEDAQARLIRAELRLLSHDLQGANADLDRLAGALPMDADARLWLAQIYELMDHFQQAIYQYDHWIEAHHDDSKMAQAMLGRCRARALAGVDLDKALADCNSAVRLEPPHTFAAFDSRGLVRLRRGELDSAIADYDAALAIKPDDAWSLYGRGLAELRKGQKASGEQDVAAARRLDSRLPDRLEKLGLTP